MPVEVDIGAPSSASANDQVAFAVRAENLGFSGVGIADHREFGCDVFVTLTLIVTQTARITVYPAVTNPVTRHPFVLAGLANSLAGIAPGRTKLAIATGDVSVVQADLRPAKLAQLREATDGIRRLLHGAPASFDGGPEHALTSPTASPPPVIVAASGPRTLRMAGEVADEALVTAGLDPAVVGTVAAAIGQGIPVTHYTMVSIDDDRDLAIERTRSWLHLWLRHGMYNIALRELGIEVPPLETADDIPTPLLHELASRLFIAGTPKDVEAQGERLASSGVERLFCMFPGALLTHHEQMPLLAKHLLPALKG
jgi:5,10-methylenetetrahydromethanopterin reductase